MASTTEHDGQLTLDDLTPAELISLAQIQLMAAATLFNSLPAEERQELCEEAYETYDDSQRFAYSVQVVETLGFDVQPPPTGKDLAPSETKTSYGLYL